MTKIRKFSRGDIVSYHSDDWVVKRKRNGMVNLIRRQVNTGDPIWVPESRLKFSDETWKSTLVKGDPVKVLLGGQWVTGRVLRREGSNVCIQPSFTNMTVRLHQSSGHIAQASHDFPLWSEDVIRPVLFQGTEHLERGHGLMFPWEYGVSMPVRSLPLTLISKVQLPVVHTRGFPMSMYNSLSRDEILYDIHSNNSSEMPELLKKLSYQYINQRAPRYQVSRSDCIDTYVAAALDNNDARRVNELLSIGANTGVWATSEFAMYRHFSRAYFVPEITYDESLQTITVEIFWSGVRFEITPSIKKILQLISEPIQYAPAIIEVHGSPEIAYILSRMLGMELEPLEKLYLRNVGQHWLTLQGGFCTGSFKTYGGVVNAPGVDNVTLVRELMKRSPLKTLVVVETDTLPMWGGFSYWHGSRRQDGPVVVTTRSTLLRSWTSMSGFKRLICTAIPTVGTVYHNVISNMPCTVRWALWNSPESSYGTTFNVLGLPYHHRGVVSLTKTGMQKMGVVFPTLTVQKFLCNPKRNLKHITNNIAHMSYSKRKEYMSIFLLNPNLVMPYIRGEKIDTYNGTLCSIADKFNLDKDLLDIRITETCAICLDTITEPAVTPCGHVFCSVCAAELDKRNINCALCRAKVHGYIRVSDQDTPGRIVMHKGSCYRVPENEGWGAKYNILKQHTDATFVTEYGSVKRALRKAFPTTKVLTTKALQHGVRVQTSKVVMVEPGPLPYLDQAWGQDLKIITLGYTVKL